jgi:hypothetical protein
MKKKTIKLMAALLLGTGIMVTGCLSDKSDNTPLPSPSGKFDGQFRMLRKKTTGSGYDTVKKETIRLTIKPDSGYKVTGDTILHAGSHGSYEYNYYYIGFDDVTSTSAKSHLDGVYQYYYDGTIFQIARNYADTLKLQYDLKKAN